MKCPLVKEQQDMLFKKVYADLLRLSRGTENFDLDNYIKNLHDQILAKTEDPALALSYAQMVPDKLLLVNSVRRKITTPLKAKGYDLAMIDAKVDQFQDINEVEKVVNPMADPELVKSNMESAITEAQSPAQDPVSTPEEITQQARKNISFKAKVNTPNTTTDQEAMSETSNVKNPEKAFKFDFIRLLTKKLSDENSDPTKVKIGNHTGFRLKAVKGSSINTDLLDTLDPTDKRMFETGLTTSGQAIKTSPKRVFDSNTLTVVTDNEGNILYFDKDYNTVSAETPGAKLIYFSMRTNMNNIQSVEELAESIFTPTESIGSLEEALVKDKKLYDKFMERAQQMRDSQNKTFNAIRDYLQALPKEGVLLDITDTSTGYLAIEREAEINIDAIDWKNSDIEYHADYADREDLSRGETPGEVYIRVKNNKSIPIQRKDLSARDVDGIISLLFDKNLKVIDNRRTRAIDQPTRKRLVNNYTLENNKGIQVHINHKGSMPNISLEGVALDLSTPESIELAKGKVKEFLTRKKLDKNGNPLTYNIRQAQYALKKSKSSSDVEMFTIEDGIVNIENVTYSELVKRQGMLSIMPNEQDRIILLNGYMKYTPAFSERAKLGLKDSDVEFDTETTESLEPAAVRSEPKKEVEPETKVEEAKQADTKGKGRFSGNKPLYAARVIQSKATPAQIKAAKTWWNSHPLSKYIAFNEMFNIVNSDAWAEFTGSAINLYSGADHSLLYHEAWHAFSELFLTQDQQKALYDELAKTKEGKKAIKGIKNKLDQYLALEELIAEDFRQYVLSGGEILGKPVRNNIFQKIWEFLKKVFGGYTAADRASGKVTKELQDLYDTLFVGKINVKPKQANRLFSSPLYSRIEGPVSDPSLLNDQDSMIITQSIDSVIIDLIDEENASRGDTAFTSILFTQPELYLSPILSEVKERFIQKAQEFEAQLDTLNSIERDQMVHKIDVLKQAVKYWDASNGTVEYFKNKSPLISSEIKNIDLEFLTKDADIPAFDKAGNDVAAKDLVSNRIQYLIKSLKQYEDGEPVVNELGFNKLMHAGLTWRYLFNILSDRNDSPREIQSTLNEASLNTPWITDLLNKLGPVDNSINSSVDVWTEFWAAMNLAQWQLYQVSVNEFVAEDGSIEYEALIGYASAAFRRVERDFKSYFKTVRNAEYIIDTPKSGNRLDFKVLDEFKNKIATPVQKIEFLNAIGLPISNTPDIISRIDSVRVDFIYDKIKAFSDKSFFIYDIIDALREDVVGKNESSNVNKILNLQAKYSGQYANTAVSTADGNDKYEEIQMSSLANIARSINKAKHFRELIAQPHMSFLDPKNNPAVAAGASVWLKSLYRYDPNTNTYGERLPGTELKVDVLSGTQNQINKAYPDYDYSTSTASADKYTRLLQDIYTGLIGGRFSTMVPADKSTTLSIYVTKVDTGADSADKHLYVDLADFANTGVQGIRKAFYLLLPHLESELIRIERVKSGNVPHIPGYTVADSKGNLRGESLAMFDNIFVDTKEQILKAGSINNISSELETEMIREFAEYVNWSTANTITELGQMAFIDKHLQERIDKAAGSPQTHAQSLRMIAMSYTLNTFIHHAESFAVAYGDLAQYKDFPKRNPGIQSTGRVFRTDHDIISFINSESFVARPWARKMGIVEKELSQEGIIDTAIIEENTVPSKMIEHPDGIQHSPYGKALYNHFIKNNDHDKALALTEQTLAPYNKMDEGDAQGWITFDAYRILAKLEGRWTIKQDQLFKQIVNNPDSVKVSDVLEYFPPRKYQYFGPLMTTGVHAMAFHKYSLFPLIPTAIEGKNIETLHNNMMKQGIDYATFQSGSKVSTITAQGNLSGDSVYEDKATRKIKEEMSFTKNPIHLRYLKDQLDVNAKYKGKVIFSTQLRKLIEEGLIEGGVPVDFKPDEKDLKARKKAWDKVKNKKSKSPMFNRYKTYEDKISKFIEFRKAKIKKEIGWDGTNFNNGVGLNKLVEFITKQLDTQDIAEHSIDFIKVNDKGELVHDLSISLTAPVIERALTAIVNNSLIRQKVNGEALVQLASTMFEPRSATESELLNHQTNDLKTYRQDPVTGKTLPMHVKISLQGDFLNLVHLKHKDGKKIAVYTFREKELASGNIVNIKELDQKLTLQRLNETIQDEEWRAENLDLISMVGVRIPVQGLNSMEYMAVWEFLPTEAGNVLIPPSEMVAKSGSDFDIDKLTVMMPSISVIGGVPQIIKEIENDKSHNENIERADELKAKIKEVRKDVSDLKKEEREAYDNIPLRDLTPEEEIEVANLRDSYLPKLRELDKTIRDLEFNIERLYSYETLTENQEVLLEESENLLEYYDNEKAELEEEFVTAKKEWGQAKSLKRNTAYQKAEKLTRLRKELQASLTEMQVEQLGLTDKAIENSMMNNIKDILSMPENFVSLITPNSTSYFTEARGDKPSIVEELSSNRDYNEINGFKTNDKVSPTRVMEPAFNVNLHERNAVGKETLGLGAVDNTFNVLLNRVGAYMNPIYTTSQKKERRATILLDHNKYGESISLSHIYGKDGIKIADIINQLMNGWVDVAKDAWVFDIQGNKQVTPVLLFLIQAGVPYETAIYFVSNPLVREYVKEQKAATSAFAKALNRSPKEFSYYRNHARSAILSKLGYKVFNSFGNLKGDKLYDIQKEVNTNFNSLVHQIAKYSAEMAMKDKNAKEAFLHYLELEELARGVSELKMNLSYDTTRSTTLFDAQRAEANLKTLQEKDMFPESVINGILEESPVGSFRVAPFQLEIWGPLFKIRNHDAINSYLIDKLSSSEAVKKMKQLMGSDENYVNEFKNDFIVKMFTEAVKKFDPNQETYKGLSINKSLKKADFLKTGVAIKDDVIYLDPEVLDLQYKHKLFSESQIANSPLLNKLAQDISYSSHKLAPVNPAAFTGMNGKDEYYRFVIEREYLRSMMSFEDVSRSPYFEYRYKHNLQTLIKLEEESQESYSERILRLTYEMILRDKALNNTLNYWHLFKSKNSFANQFFEIKEMHPELLGKYMVVDDMIMSTPSQTITKDGKRTKDDSFSNLAFRDSRTDKETTEVYYQNILDLSNPDIISISEAKYSDAEDMYAENNRVADFFDMLPIVAFLQSGLNSSDPLSMVKSMPMDKIVSIIESVTPEIESKLQDTYFISIFAQEFAAQNSKANISIRKRLKNYMPNKFELIPTYNITNSNIDGDFSVSVDFRDGQNDVHFREEFKDKVMFDLIAAEEVSGISLHRSHFDKDVKPGDTIVFTKPYVKTEYGESKRYTASINAVVTDVTPVSFLTPETWSKKEGISVQGYDKIKDNGYVQITFELISFEEMSKDEEPFMDPNNKTQLESLIKNNPNIIFVLDGGTDGTSYAGTIDTNTDFPNVVNIITRDSSAKPWTRETVEQNKTAIKESLDKLEELANSTEKAIVFLSPNIGYGTYLADKISPSTNEMMDFESFEYLTTELYTRFGYINKGAKAVTDVQEIMTQNQDLEYKIDVPSTEIYEAMQRLNCKL